MCQNKHLKFFNRIKVENIANADLKSLPRITQGHTQRNCAGLHVTSLALKVVSLIARDFIFSREALKVIIVCVFFVHNSLLAASRISFSSLISVINFF